MKKKSGINKAPLIVHAGKWVQQGVTLAHHPQSRKSIFIHGAIPGELIKINITKVRSDHLFATVIEVLEKAENRQSDLCKIFPACGGCSFQHISYPEEIELKKELLKDWKYLSKCMQSVDWKFHSDSPKTWRNHVQCQSVGNKWGFFGLHSNQLVEFPFEGCLNISDELSQTIRQTRVNKNGKYSFRESGNTTALVEKNYLIEEEIQYDQNKVLKWKYPSRGFWQVNKYLLPVWAQRAAQILAHQNDMHLVELFCGSALLGGLMADRLASYTGFDSDARCLRAAKENFKKFKMPYRFTNKNLFESIPVLEKSWNVCIANPPRSGLKNELIQSLNDSAIKTFLYSSCNPATLNRDLKPLLSAGFKPISLDVFDFFPRTWHLEIMILLERS